MKGPPGARWISSGGAATGGNTRVVVAHVATLVGIGRQRRPPLSERLAKIAPFADREDEPWAIRPAYHLAAPANFSRAILEPGPPGLAAVRLPAGLAWADWGTPARVVESLREARDHPAPGSRDWTRPSCGQAEREQDATAEEAEKAMRIAVTAQDLLAAIEWRLAEISQLQHTLAVERTHLQEQTTRLRLGALSPEAVLIHLKAHGVTLGGFAVHAQKARRLRPARSRPR